MYINNRLSETEGQKYRTLRTALELFSIEIAVVSEVEFIHWSNIASKIPRNAIGLSTEELRTVDRIQSKFLDIVGRYEIYLNW